MTTKIEIVHGATDKAEVYIDGERQTAVVDVGMEWYMSTRSFKFSMKKYVQGHEVFFSTTDFTLTYNEESTMTPQEFPQVKPIAALALGELQAVCHVRARNAGWWDAYAAMPAQYRKYVISSQIALIHSEVSEALEAFRKTKRDDHLPHRQGVEVELADAVIRILDLGGAMGLDIIGALVEKLEYNAQRQDHTREARAAEGGKQI